MADQNVFDIKDAGVAIALGLKGQRADADNQIQTRDLWGDRNADKYPFLLSNTVASQRWTTVASEPDLFLFRTLSQEGATEYTSWLKVTEVFPLYSVGIITARDGYVIDFETEPIVRRARAFRESRLGDEATCEALGIPIKKGWNISRARDRLSLIKDLESCVRPLLYRPFDVRRVFYHESLIWGMAWPVMQHMIGGTNLALVTSRMTKGESFRHVLVSRTLSEVILLSSKTSNNAFVFPLSLCSAASDLQLGQQTNLSPFFLKLLADKLRLRRLEASGLPEGISPENIFHYLYAILNSPGYRSRYAEFLRIDFPRLPLTESLEMFRVLAALGGDVVSLHLMESPALNKSLTTFTGSANPEIEKISYARDTVWLDKAQTRGFRGVPEPVWEFHIGGYQVCEKWLKDRKGRTLSKDDITHYQKIVVALSETIRLMAEIDKVIDANGGWPGAFAIAKN